MKRTLQILPFLLLLLFLINCSDDPKFPDPGFDLISDKKVTIRRDTTNTYTIRMNIEAPGGIDYIQILNGRNYDVLDEITEYKNQKKFLFEYTIDFSSIETSKDTILVYNVKVVTNDRRAFNSSYMVNLKRLSVPEIILPFSDVLGTNSNLINVQGAITTGIYTLSSIDIYINDRNCFTITSKEIGDVSEYDLAAIISYPFENNMPYKLKISIKDNIGQELVVEKEVRKVPFKKPKAMQLINQGKVTADYNVVYDELERITCVTYVPVENPTANAYKIDLTYNSDGLVERMYYRFHLDPGWITMVFAEFSYIDGEVSQIHHARYSYDDPSNISTYDLVQNIIYRPDRSIKQFDFGISTMEEVHFTDGFEVGEKIYSEYIHKQLVYLNLTERQIKTGFVPILNPLYFENMPKIWGVRWITEQVADLFWYKYIYTANDVGYNSEPNPYSSFNSYNYECDENGQLISFTILRYGSSDTRYHNKYVYIYD